MLRRNQLISTERYPTVPGPVSPVVPFAGDEKKLEQSGTDPDKEYLGYAVDCEQHHYLSHEHRKR